MSRVRVNNIATKDASKQFKVADIVDMLTNASGLKAASSADAATLKSLSEWFKQTNRATYENHIINGNFDIWQRATTFTFNTTATSAQAKYTADRWLFQCQANNATITQQFTSPGIYEQLGNMSDKYMRITLSNLSSSSSYAVLNQRIEKPMRFLGKTITVSFMAKASANGLKIGVEAAQFTGKGGSIITGTGKSVSLTTSWSRYSVSVTIPTNSNAYSADYSGFLELGIWLDGQGENFGIRSGINGRQSGNFDIAQIQLEIGDSATPYRPKKPQDELQDCYRYFWKGLPCLSFSFNSYAAESYMSWNIQYPRVMRDVPSVSFYFNGGTVNTNYSANLNIQNINFGASTVHGGLLLLQSLAVDPNIYLNLTSDSYFQADAELYIT